MTDREKVTYGLRCMCYEDVECKECPNARDGSGWYGCRSNCVEDALSILKEQEEERRNIVHWLGKFCAYLDFKDECWSYEQNLAFFRKKMKEQFGWDVGES